MFAATVVAQVIPRLTSVIASANLAMFLVNWQGVLLISLIVGLFLGLDKFFRLMGKDLGETDSDDYMTLLKTITKVNNGKKE